MSDWQLYIFGIAQIHELLWQGGVVTGLPLHRVWPVPVWDMGSSDNGYHAPVSQTVEV